MAQFTFRPDNHKSMKDRLPDSAKDIPDSPRPGSHAPKTEWEATGEAEIQAVRSQLERILEHPYFCRSRRCTSLLRYIVEKSLSAEYELKERTLGIEVFGRSPDYETNTDPIVRNTAHDARKRLAQYYCEPDHANELRIDLPPGSYVPRFYLPEMAAIHKGESENDALALSDVKKPAVELSGWPASKKAGPFAYALIALLCAAVIASAAALRPWRTTTAVDTFWAPLLKGADKTVLVTVGEPAVYSYQNNIHPVLMAENGQPWNIMAVNDTLVLAKIMNYLGTEGKISSVHGESTATLDDLKRGPDVFIGAFDNKWTIALSQELYYRLNPYPRGSGSISGPNGQEWTMGPDGRDYAIVARFRDPMTHQFVVLVAGIGEPGNIAAGDFLTNPELLQQAMKSSGRDWAHGNVEIVLSTKLTSGVVDPPKVVAMHTW